jgi:hypothetical protein
MMLGLELLQTGAIAVSVDERGRVAKRCVVGPSGDLTAAALAALEGIGAGGESAAPLSVASMNPESAGTAAALAAVSDRFRALAIEIPPVASGTAATVAETWVGAAPGAKNVVFFAIAEQTSAGILRDGTPMVGAHGRAPAVAWLALNPVEREDYRKTGCLEAEVGAAGIVRRLIWRIKAGDRSRVTDTVAGDFTAITVDHLLTAARAGDGVSISVVRDTAKYLGMAAANLVAIADPDVLILGGIMSSAADLLLEPVRVELARRIPIGATRCAAATRT